MAAVPTTITNPRPSRKRRRPHERAVQAAGVARRLEVGDVGEERRGHALEHVHRGPHQHGRGEDDARLLAVALAFGQDHEQRAAVHQQLIGAGDDAGRRREAERSPQLERLARPVVPELRQAVAPVQDGDERAADGSRNERGPGDALREAMNTSGTATSTRAAPSATRQAA